uniref:Uncharacterized protein n=1 Tax=Oryza brachyantha TaxID=4533 RepID=J3N1D9_ORYBR
MGEFHRAVNGTIICEMMPNQRAPPSSQQATQRDSGSEKIVLQPRLCTLRSYSAGSGLVARRRLVGEEVIGGGADGAGSSPFFVSLADYIDSTRKSQNFEIISGRLAMVSFASHHRLRRHALNLLETKLLMVHRLSPRSALRMWIN